MARVVVVLTDPPLPFGNAVARWFFVLFRGLVERGHHTTVLAACDSPLDAKEARELFPAPRYDLRLFPYPVRKGIGGKIESFRRPYSYLFANDMQQELDVLMEEGCEILHLEQIWSGWMGLKYTDRAVLNITYLCEIDLAEQVGRSIGDQLRWLITKRAERRLLRSYPTITTLTPRLSKRVRELSPRSRVETVPLGYDLSLYPFAEGRIEGDPPVVALIGSFHWQPTLSAAKRLLQSLWPEIHRRCPAAKLMIVGRKAKSALASLTAGIDVELVEDVPDMLPYWRKTDVLLYAPTRGSGMKVKVLEALALGVPVVTNSDGVEGLEAIDRVHCGIAEDDAGLIERTVLILENPRQTEAMRTAARALVEETCSPDHVLDRLEQVYRTIAKSPADVSRAEGPS